MIKTILFDLDGTLLPIEHQKFVDLYFGEMVKSFAMKGFDAKVVLNAVLEGTQGMRLNEGPLSNNDVFWNYFTTMVKGDPLMLKAIFEDFYQHRFDLVKASTSIEPLARPLIKELKKLGYTLILATNPLFPAISTHKRIIWANLDKEDFSIITTIETGYASKPNPKYFINLLAAAGNLDPKTCLMIGNDAIEDLAATKVGIETFLITDHLINKNKIDLSMIPQGNFSDLIVYLNKKLGIQLIL